MKHFFSIALITLSCVGVLAIAPLAHAETYDECLARTNDYVGCANTASGSSAPASTPAPTGAASNGGTSDGGTYQTCLKSSDAVTCANKYPEATTNPGANTNTDSKPGSDIDSRFGTTMTWIMRLFAWLVGVAALTLDYAVYYTVVKMGSYVNNLSAIGVTWRILRDAGNIMLIFGFLAVGITTILNVDWYGGGKKMLPMLLVAAVFLNFSLFFAEAVIDAGNLFATQFYAQINGGSLPNLDTTSVGVIGTGKNNEGISNRIMAQLGLQSIYGDTLRNPKIFEGGHTWIIAFMGILLFIVAAFVMFSLAFILIARFVALIFLIILAPVGFAGLAIPQMEKRAGQWWKKLIEQTVTAPILLLMLYIALAVITDVNFLTGFGVAGGSSGSSGVWTSIVTSVTGANVASFASMMLSFLVAMGLLIAVTIQSKNLSAFGAGFATKTAGKLTFGATAFGLRSTAGWGSHALSQGLRRTKFGSTKTGRVAAQLFDKGAKASFDVRGIAMGGGLKGIGVDAGKAAEGGYRARREGVIKRHEEYAESIKKAGTGFFEERKIGLVEEKLAKLEEEHRPLKEEHDKANKEVEKRKAEIVALEEEKKKDKYWETNPANVQRMDAAQKNLATSEANLAGAVAKLSPIAENLTNAKKEKEEAEKTANSRIKGGQLKYAENAKGFGSWLAFGPGGGAAAKKIIKETMKSKEEHELDMFKKALKKIGDGEPSGSKPPAAPTDGGGH